MLFAVADAPEGEPLDPALLELEPSIEDVLEDGVKRLKEKGTWKLWQWPADGAEMFDAEAFRQHITVGRGPGGTGFAGWRRADGGEGKG